MRVLIRSNRGTLFQSVLLPGKASVRGEACFDMIEPKGSHTVGVESALIAEGVSDFNDKISVQR